MALIINSGFASGSMTVGGLYCYVFSWDGTKITSELVEIGTGSAGSLPPVPLPMSAMPVAKARIDVHPFSLNIGPTARRSGHADLTVPAGLSAYFNVVAYQSALPGTNKGQRPDSREFDQIMMTAAIMNDTTLRLSWVATGPIIGNFNFLYQIKN